VSILFWSDEAVFTIGDEKKRILTFQEYQVFVGQREGQVGGHRHIEDVGRYDLVNGGLAGPALLRSPQLQCYHCEAAL
jgi:hypothetical protein